MTPDDTIPFDLDSDQLEQVAAAITERQRVAGAKYPGYTNFRCVLAFPPSEQHVTVYEAAVTAYEVSGEVLESLQTTFGFHVPDGPPDHYGQRPTKIELHIVTVLLLGERVDEYLDRQREGARKMYGAWHEAETALETVTKERDAAAKERDAALGKLALGEEAMNAHAQATKDALRIRDRAVAEQQQTAARLVMIEAALGAKHMDELFEKGKAQVAIAARALNMK